MVKSNSSGSSLASLVKQSLKLSKANANVDGEEVEGEGRRSSSEPPSGPHAQVSSGLAAAFAKAAAYRRTPLGVNNENDADASPGGGGGRARVTVFEAGDEFEDDKLKSFRVGS